MLDYRQFKDYKIALITLYLSNKLRYSKGFNFKHYKNLELYLNKDFIIFEIL